MGHGTHLHQFAMQMQHMSTPGALMQIVHILGDDVGVEMLFKLLQAKMTGIRLTSQQFVPALVVELMHKSGVAPETVSAGHVHHRILLPKPSGIAEGADTALGAHSGACAYHELLHISLF